MTEFDKISLKSTIKQLKLSKFLGWSFIHYKPTQQGMDSSFNFPLQVAKMFTSGECSLCLGGKKTWGCKGYNCCDPEWSNFSDEDSARAIFWRNLKTEGRVPGMWDIEQCFLCKQRRSHICLLFSSAVAKRDWPHLLRWLQCHPCPPALSSKDSPSCAQCY